MVIFPNCKINLGLRVLRKRTDGYHDLETVFYQLPVKDVLEVVENRVTGSEMQDAEHWMLDTGTVRFNQSGLTIDGNAESNLCIKAYDLLKKDFPALPAIRMHLHKNIPIGAGLGGGSADGAFTLRLLNAKFNLKITTEKLIDYAAQLGSDSPLFIINKPCLATGRGELLQPIPLDLSHFSWLLVSPAIHINTAWAYSTIVPSVPALSLNEIIQWPVQSWNGQLINDFEIPVFKKYPEIQEIKSQLYKYGAVYASMTGSGSSVYGLFSKNHLPKELFPGNNYRIDRVL